MSITINTAEELDNEIREIDLMIAELTREQYDVEANKKEMGDKERSPEMLRALAPFKQHIAELMADRSFLSHRRTQYETVLVGAANDRWYIPGNDKTTPPSWQFAVLYGLVSHRDEYTSKHIDAEAEIMRDTLAGRLEASVESTS